MKILEHKTGDISGTFPVHRKFGVSDAFSAHRRDRMHSAGTYDTYTKVTFPVHFLDVAYTSKMYYVCNVKYTQIEASIPSLYKVYKVYK